MVRSILPTRTALTIGLLAVSAPAVAQPPTPAWADSFVVITPGPQYGKGGLFRALAGDHNRDLWTTSLRVPLLDLERFAGGLTPLSAHAGSQTKSLRFAGRDGRQYQFRSVDKDPTAALSPELQGTSVARALQDGVSSSNPVASLVASALLEAAGVLHVEQTLVVMPDDPALGEFRADFRGVFGMIEERPDETDEEASAFAGARRIVSPERLFERIDESPDDRVDARAFLTARLMDILMGDRDRHRDQFRWATFDDAPPRFWKPISRDHDEAFVKIDGPILDIVRVYYPPLVDFEEEYPNPVRLNWHSREVDRRFLVELDRQVWDSVATALQHTLTDDVLDRAVRRMPPEMYAVAGDRMTALLRIRRDSLRAEALGYYAFLSEEVEVRATDAREVATVTRTDDHHLTLEIRPRGEEEPYFRRTFDDAETREVRLMMWGADDRVFIRGEHAPRILLRVIGGHGDDLFVDSTHVGRVRFYDDHGHDEIASARGAKIDTKPHEEWRGNDLDRYPPREWGTWWRPVPWVTASSDLGVFLGGGVLRTEYGFRRMPYASHIRARVGYATGANAMRADFDAELHPENATPFWRVHALASGIEILRYYGLGNDTEDEGPTDYHKVSQQQYAVEPAFLLPMGPHAELRAGLSGRWSHTGENEGRFLATIGDTLYGGGDFGQVGAQVGVSVDTRDHPLNARRGVYVRAEARAVPALWSVREAFASLDGEAATFLAADIPTAPTLALRVGGRVIAGDAPFHEAAFLGGHANLRGYASQRFAGDASAFGSAELRIRIARSGLAIPVLWGLFGNADAGRVFVDGESPGGWHTGVGGGIWAGFLGLANTASLGITTSAEGTAVYANIGFGF